MDNKEQVSKLPIVENFSAGIIDVQVMFPGLKDSNRDQYHDRFIKGLWEMLDKNFPEDVEAMRGKKFQFLIK